MNTMVSAAALPAALLLAWPTVSGAQSVPVPILDPPGPVVSLHRPHAEWKVVTTIVLAIQPNTDHPVTFRWSKPTLGTIACHGLSDDAREVTVPAGTPSIACSYQPAVGSARSDSFIYRASFMGGVFSDPATVAIDIRERGLRWEFKTAGATVTSDSPDPEALAEIPAVLGSNDQDFLLSVNWQTMRPRRRLMETALARAPRLLLKSELAVADNMASRSANFLVETGVLSEAVAATVTDVGSSATTESSSGDGTGTTTEQSVARRNLVLRGEFNYNAGFNADGAGRFLEVGGLARGSFSTVMNSNESFRETLGRVLQVVPKDRSAFRFDGGIRLAIKQAHETDATVIVNPEGQVEPPTNIENYVLVELTLRHDSGLTGLATDTPDGDSRHRWAFRAEFSPEISYLPGHQLPTIGVEVSKAWAGGPAAVKVTYGVNLSASKGVIKN
jgi:hypothetical protein